MKKQNVVFITTHPDDVAFSMGGTAALLKNKYNLHILCISSGDRGYKWNGEGLPPRNRELGISRENEEREAAKLINAQVTFFNEPDGEVFAGKEICCKIAEILSNLEPIAIFTMGPFEKSDHSATTQIARQALFIAKRFWETEFYMLVPYSHSNVYNPSIYVNITNVIEDKKKQVFCHQHYLCDPTYWDKLLEENKIMGTLAVHCEYAEAYFVELPTVTSRWNRKFSSILMDLN